ncbi:hypothetical protein CASFOL_026378 [Castilleja foliolosa]|uniref:DUF2428 domain-containing protein n=1 Tax=Castilleja foliolosa TaxID=1961234 RepID=A0ABD3CJM3_9LAMI
MQHSGEMRDVIKRLLELVMRVTSLALWVVSADALSLPDEMEDMEDDEVEVEVTKNDEEIVMVGCWLAMKEVSLLLGTVIRKVPLPTSDEMRKAITNSTDESGLPFNVMLDLQQLQTIGNHFLEVLLKMKHNGAIDKTRAGFTALCNRLLCSNDPIVGKDEFEQTLADLLKENKVDNSGVRFDPSARTALAFVTLRADDEHEFMFYRHPSADMLLEKSDLDVNLIAKSHAARDGIMAVWGQADIIKISEDEISFLTRGDDPYDDNVVLQKLFHRNLRLLLVREGKDCCRYYTKRRGAFERGTVVYKCLWGPNGDQDS